MVSCLKYLYSFIDYKFSGKLSKPLLPVYPNDLCPCTVLSVGIFRLPEVEVLVLCLSSPGKIDTYCVPSFMEMWRKYIYGFTQRLTNSDNAIVAATISSCRMSSNLWKIWDSILYTASEL